MPSKSLETRERVEISIKPELKGLTIVQEKNVYSVKGIPAGRRGVESALTISKPSL